MTMHRAPVRMVWGKVWPVIKWALAFAFIIFVVPALKQALFPDLMTRLEKMLRRAALGNCTVRVKRESEPLILLTVTSGKSPITTEIYKYVLLELPQKNKDRVFFAHSINQHPDQSFYLTQTRIWADADLKQVRRLEVEYCDLLQSKDGRVNYEEHLPVYQCVHAVQKFACSAVDEGKGR